MALKRTALYDAHVAAGGRIVEFAGYEMPVQYAGVLAEARAVREGVGIFDVSHMGRLRLTGPGVAEGLDGVVTSDVGTLSPGAGRYGLLTHANGGTVDDVVVYREAEDAYRMVVNASNYDKDVAHLRAHLPSSVGIEDLTAGTVMIAVQGPAAVPLVAGSSELPMFSHEEAEVFGVLCFVARGGYTGEDGFELVCAASDGVRLWDALLAAGATPCGLASRDTLRLEAGLPLYGHEITDEVDPITAGLGWAVSKKKTFLGSDALARVRAEGAARRLAGVQVEGRRLLPVGAPVYRGDEEIGRIVSGVVSVMLGRGIGTAYVPRDVPAGTSVEVELRGARVPAEIVDKRFYRRPPAA